MGSGHRDRPLSRRRFRKVAAYVLARDGGVCRMRPDCSTPATTVDHVIPLAHDPDHLHAYDPAYLRAACPHHNFSDGGRLATRRDLGSPSRDWT